eukprot:755021-Hanusia_phi.AAC.1
MTILDLAEGGGGGDVVEERSVAASCRHSSGWRVIEGVGGEGRMFNGTEGSLIRVGTLNRLSFLLKTGGHRFSRQQKG